MENLKEFVINIILTSWFISGIIFILMLLTLNSRKLKSLLGISFLMFVGCSFVLLCAVIERVILILLIFLIFGSITTDIYGMIFSTKEIQN